MPIKSNNFTSKTKQFVNRLQGRIGEEVMMEILSTGIQYADAITPKDTGTLVNSRFKRVYHSGGRIVGEAGYATKYAWWVHQASGKLKGKQRPNNRGLFWSPDAEPRFLYLGFERDGKAEIEQIIKERHKVKNIID